MLVSYDGIIKNFQNYRKSVKTRPLRNFKFFYMGVFLVIYGNFRDLEIGARHL